MMRSAETRDYPDWRRLWDAYCAFYQIELPEAVTAATWARILDPASPVHGVLAERDGRIIGMMNYVVHPNTWSAGDICYLEDLFVDPDARGGGVGKALIDWLLAEGRRQGWQRVYWHTNAENQVARRLYDRYTPADPFVRYTVRLDN
jgi:GNAT superfamily N-acetyltransferase